MPYQYKIMSDPDEAELNELGLDGWEIVGIVKMGPDEAWPRIYLRQEIGVERAERLKAYLNGDDPQPRYFLVKAWATWGDWKGVVKIDKPTDDLQKELESVTRNILGDDFKYVRTYYETSAKYYHPERVTPPISW